MKRMIKLLSLLVVGLLTTSAHKPAFADALILTYLGPSGTGLAGVLGFNALCAATFKDGQFCSSIDILRSGSLPSEVALSQWVAPTIVGIGGTDKAFDMSGITIASGLNSLSCAGWTGGAGGGLSISATGQFRLVNCGTELAVACCKREK